MLKLTEFLQEAEFDPLVLKDHELALLLGGTQASRYSMINKALAKGDLIRVTRGVYVLAEKYRKAKLSKFYLASRIQPASYITAESALSYHGWIPERVVVTISAYNKGRRLSYQTHFGNFLFLNVATREYEFLTHVFRVTLEGKPFLIPSPLRALADLVYTKKLENVNLNYARRSISFNKTVKFCMMNRT